MLRRAGLSRSQNPPPLHKSIGNKFRPKPKEAESIDAPPLSSDDEDDLLSGGDIKEPEEPSRPAEVTDARSHEGRISLYSPGSHSEGSDNERSTRASIRQTHFTTSSIAKAPTNPRASEKSKTLRSAASSKTKRTSMDSAGVKRRKIEARASEDLGAVDNHLDSDSVSSKLSSSQTDHLKDERGFVKRQKNVRTYKGQKKRMLENTANPNPKLHVPEDIESPEKSRPFKALLPDDLLSSPSNGPPARFKSLDQDEGPIDPPSSPIPEKNPTPAIRPKAKSKTNIFIKSRRKNQKHKVASAPSSPPPPPAVFIPPADLPKESARESNLDGNGADFQLGNVESESEETLGMELLEGEKQETDQMPSCPWCGEPVEESLFKEFSRGKRLNVRMQTKFCQKHRKRTALKTWESRNYPNIEWPELEERLAKHRTFLLEIVNGKPSHFRTRLAEDIGAGKARSLKKEGNLNPGYYGPRGFNIMSDYLVREFSDLLKQRAVDDRVIAGRGSAAFIQAVLVAELGVQLIQEDLGVSTQDARDIMEESKVLGEMVHEEV